MLAKTRALVKQFVEDRHTPGAVMMVGCGRKAFGPYGMGHTSFFPDALEVGEDTIYDLASLTKVVGTTTAALLLVEAGCLSLTDTLTDFFPSVPADKADITVAGLMTHTTGISQTEFYRFLQNPDGVVKHILHTKLAFTPGTQVLYSCLNYILLAKIIEKCAGVSLDLFVNDEILEPLGMESTYHNPPTELYERIAYTEWCPFEKRFLRGCVHDENSRFLGGVSGNAGLFATAGDLGVFARMLLAEGAHGPKQFLHPATVRLIRTDRTPHLQESRSIGWQMKGKGFSSGGDLISPSAFGHTG
ncbi:MAG: beta-lactamase family protein, partial [Firmicutes bacterium]|nr:beta-lactamase family protein [Bacillota bacterium]